VETLEITPDGDPDELETVVLVDEQNRPIGQAPKATVHTGDTPLHRGFSVFLFDRRGRLLLQQRSRTKKTWPLVWSNSCCGHPRLGETSVEAARRRLAFELGIRRAEVIELLPDYRYRATRGGVTENELCPVMVAFTSDQPVPNPDEVEAVRWVDWPRFVAETRRHPERYSEWCVEETQLLAGDDRLRSLLAALSSS
jgi:isopentenyl-diphosphate delta-isomerase